MMAVAAESANVKLKRLEEAVAAAVLQQGSPRVSSRKHCVLQVLQQMERVQVAVVVEEVQSSMVAELELDLETAVEAVRPAAYCQMTAAVVKGPQSLVHQRAFETLEEAAEVFYQLAVVVCWASRVNLELILR
jgi:hypothetical protein